MLVALTVTVWSLSLPKAASLDLSLNRPVNGVCTPERFHRFPSGWPKEFDVGVYWFSYKDKFDKHYPGQRSPFFDPTKPTFIYVHGWTGNAGGWVSPCFRQTTTCPPDMCADERFLIDGWLDNGWNFGIFYWEQFSDEACVRDAEQKVWGDFGTRGIPWKHNDEGGEETRQDIYPGDIDSVADLCASSISSAMADFRGTDFRLVGHSLGTQMASHCASLLHFGDFPENVRPTRLVLLDPYFSIRRMMGLLRCGQFTFEEGIGHFPLHSVATIISNLYQKGVPTFVRTSSVFPFSKVMGDVIDMLEPLVVLVKQWSHWCGQEDLLSASGVANFACTHKAAFVDEFLAPSISIPVEYPEGEEPICNPTTALSCSDSDMLALQTQQMELDKAGKFQFWNQIAGANTIRTEDDAFEFKRVRLNKAEKAAVRAYVGHNSTLPGKVARWGSSAFDIMSEVALCSIFFISLGLVCFYLGRVSTRRQARDGMNLLKTYDTADPSSEIE